MSITTKDLMHLKVVAPVRTKLVVKVVRLILFTFIGIYACYGCDIWWVISEDSSPKILRLTPQLLV